MADTVVSNLIYGILKFRTLTTDIDEVPNEEIENYTQWDREMERDNKTVG